MARLRLADSDRAKLAITWEVWEDGVRLLLLLLLLGDCCCCVLQPRSEVRSMSCKI